MRPSKRAIALISVLLFSSVFLMMVGALVWRVKMTGAFAGLGRDDLAAQAAAEAGLARCLCELSQDKSWAANLPSQSLPDSQATFSIQWNTSHSVNNLLPDTNADGPQGPGSVAPHTAYVMVDGQCAARTCRLEAIVASSGLTTNSPALSTTGNITFGNDVTITGQRSLGDSTKISANVISTKSTGENDIIKWSGSGSATIEGSVLSNGSSAGAISSNLNPSVVTGSVKNGQSTTPPARVDISARVAAKTGATTPTLSGTSQTLGSGDFYFPSGVNYNGDLDLNGSNLYVSGNFQINGSIRGKGSIFVTGSSTLQGDSQVVAGDDQQIALYGKGNVTLSGFNGSAALASLASSSGSDANGVPYTTHLSNMKLWGNQMQSIQQQVSTLVAANPGSAMPATTLGVVEGSGAAKIFGNAAWGGSYSSDFDYLTDIMGFQTGDNYRNVPLHGKYTGVVPKLYQMVNDNATAGPTKDFLLKKLAGLRDPLDTNKGVLAHHTGLTDAEADLDAALATGNAEGLFDAVNDAWADGTYMTAARRAKLARLLAGSFQALDMNHIGSSYFRGLVYTEGNLVAQNDLIVMGSLVGVGPSSNLTLDNSIKVVYVPEISRRAGETLGVVSVKTWLRR
ncbi:hypothetical protein JST97_03255 [bacterium]|nr:hypothetical protein [bacterium]